jgi:hypothetical protein
MVNVSNTSTISGKMRGIYTKREKIWWGELEK